MNEILQLEQDIITANGRGWVIGDKITIAQDEDTWTWFVLDLSCTHWEKKAWDSVNNEEYQVRELFTRFGFENLAARRQSAHHAASELWINDDFKFFAEQTGTSSLAINYVYGSFYRPITNLWATLPKECFTLQNERLNHDKQIPLTYLFTPAPLSDKTLYDYELTLCWQRWTECPEGSEKYRPKQIVY